jgi:ELWxxDGT repeat protein
MNTIAGDRYVYFTAEDGVHGVELWLHDPTEGETRLVSDIAPGAASSEPVSLFLWNGVLFFSASDANVRGSGHELWRSDGTRAGTYLVRNINEQPGVGSHPRHFSALGEQLLFLADDGVHGDELWCTDGTAEGTRFLKDAHPEGRPNGTTTPPAVIGDRAYFRVLGDLRGGALWQTDATANGTVVVIDEMLDLEGHFGNLITFQDEMLFVASGPEMGIELWRSNGTVEGTILVKDVNPGKDSAAPSELQAFGGHVIFQARDAIHGNELWKSDGTEAGTELLCDVAPGARDSDPYPIIVAGDRFFFSAETESHGRELWVSDGTTAGTHEVADIYPNRRGSEPYAITSMGEYVLFSADDGVHGEELWRSDGTQAGTYLVRDVWPGPENSECYALQVLDGVAYFEANDGRHGNELWRSDGTQEGTYLLADIAVPDARQPSGDPTALVGGKNELFFVARGTDGAWYLWYSDGTGARTHIVSTELKSARPDAFRARLGTENGIYMTVEAADETIELWGSDGTRDGTQRIAVLGTLEAGTSFDSLAHDGDVVYFAKSAPATGIEPWRIARWGAEPELLRDLAPGPASSNPRAFARVIGTGVYCVADDGVHGEEVWLLGPNGPLRVSDIASDAADSRAESLTDGRGRLFFVADDGVHGPELWTISEDVPILVGDVNPVQHPSAIAPQELVAVDAGLFCVMDDGVHGRELWFVDWASLTPRMVRDVMPGAVSANPEELAELKGRVLYRAESPGTGSELFVSNGTHAGTYMLQDLVARDGSGRPKGMTTFRDRLYFSARSREDGVPWQGTGLYWTDGVRTEAVAVSMPGGVGNPAGFTAADEEVFFAADTLEHGRELWKVWETSIGDVKAALVKDLLPPGRTSIPAPRR